MIDGHIRRCDNRLDRSALPQAGTPLVGDRAHLHAGLVLTCDAADGELR